MDKTTDLYRASQQRELADLSNGPTSTDLNLPTEVCTGTATTKEQSQRRAFNLIPIMVSNDRPTCKDRYAAELIMARRDVLHSKAEYIAADLSIVRSFSLAVLRRTIHYQDDLSCPNEHIGDLALSEICMQGGRYTQNKD